MCDIHEGQKYVTLYVAKTRVSLKPKQLFV